MRLGVGGIGARVIAAVMALTAFALFAAGATLFLQARTLAEQRVAASLGATVDLVRSLSAEPDPVTGEPFASADAVLQAAFQRTQFGASEGALGYVDGELWWVAPTGVAYRPEDNPHLLAAVTPLTTLSVTSDGRVTAGGDDAWFIVVPVHFGAGATNDGATGAGDRFGEAGAEGVGGAFVKVVDMRAELAPIRALVTWFAVIGGAVLTLTALLIWILVGRLLRPITVLRDTAAAITEHDLTQRVPVLGNDELSQLSATVNSMLDRIESAVTSQRNLLDDVGHELRTPLTIIRGNIELLDAADSAEVESTKSLVIDEVDRMHRLVNDLLTLAKADQADFIRLQPVEVARLTDDTYQKAISLGQREWRLDQAADVTAMLDPQRVAQAWLQLVSNAVQYSEPGSRISVGSRATGGELHLWVSDHGIGIDPAQLDAIQGRKRRGGPAFRLSAGPGGHPRIAPGPAGGEEHAGLGLAIVTAIVQAHGGHLEIESAVGQGSTFTMALPLN